MPDDAGPWIERKTERFTLTMLVGTDADDPVNDNLDIEVVLVGDEQRWGALSSPWPISTP